jgi:PAS domain S-box-containing protein
MVQACSSEISDKQKFPSVRNGIMKEMFLSVLHGLQAGLFVCDAAKPGFPIVQVHSSFSDLTGYTAREAVGSKLSILFGSKTEPTVVRSINQALRRTEAFRGELLCYHSDGRTAWYVLISVPRPARAGRAARAVMALIDVSERKHREEHLKRQEINYHGIFKHAIEGIYQSTAEGRYLQVNLALAKMYGYSSPDALMQQVSDIEHQIYVDPLMRERFKRLIGEADCVRGLEYQVRRRDGRIIWISENARVVRDGNGGIQYYEGFIEEITKRKDAEAALQRSQQELIETSRQIGLAEMADGVLHNVGNALNSVNASVSSLADKLAGSKASSLSKVMGLLNEHQSDLARFLTHDPKGGQLIGYLGQLTQHLLREHTCLKEEVKSLIKTVEHATDIIAFQQNSAKNNDLIETAQIAELVEDALRMNANSLMRHRIEVVRDFAPNLPPVVVPKHQVLQILVNLIRNAKTACAVSKSPEKRLIVRTGFEPTTRRIHIEVKDNGVGIPPENLTRIFTHGFTTRKNGHGFGLHSGVRIATELGGSLSVHSGGLGQGSSFVVEFPCQPPLAEAG